MAKVQKAVLKVLRDCEAGHSAADEGRTEPETQVRQGSILGVAMLADGR